MSWSIWLEPSLVWVHGGEIIYGLTRQPEALSICWRPMSPSGSSAIQLLAVVYWPWKAPRGVVNYIYKYTFHAVNIHKNRSKALLSLPSTWPPQVSCSSLLFSPGSQRTPRLNKKETLWYRCLSDFCPSPCPILNPYSMVNTKYSKVLDNIQDFNITFNNVFPPMLQSHLLPTQTHFGLVTHPWRNAWQAQRAFAWKVTKSCAFHV